jgi:hypothetical protein
MDIQHWINSFMSDDGEEHHLALLKHICNYNNMDVPIPKTKIDNQLHYIYLREMYDWLTAFLSKYSEESYLYTAEKYAKLADVNLPLSDSKKEIILKSIYLRKMEFWLNQFFKSDSKIEYYKMAISYANKAKIDIPINNVIIEDRLDEIKRDAFIDIKNKFIMHYPKYIFFIYDIFEYNKMYSLKNLFIENLSISFIKKTKEFEEINFLLKKIKILLNLPNDILKIIYQY